MSREIEGIFDLLDEDGEAKRFCVDVVE